MSKGSLIVAWALLLGISVGNLTPYIVDYFETRPYRDVEEVSVD